MWFLIKGSFWFGLVLVALSVFSSESFDNAGHPQLQLSDAFTAASGAYDYMTGMCSEKARGLHQGRGNPDGSRLPGPRRRPCRL